MKRNALLHTSLSKVVKNEIKVGEALATAFARFQTADSSDGEFIYDLSGPTPQGDRAATQQHAY